MTILFMGTGADDWSVSKRKDGEFFRRLTSTKINDDLMVDCSAGAEDYIKMNNISLSGVKDLVITHTHGDHYNPDTIKAILNKDIRIWAEENAIKRIASDLPQHNVCRLDLFTPVKVGEYEIIGVPANHSVSDKNQIPLHYIITKGNKTLFWGCDGSWFLNQSWHEIKKYKYDLFVLDGTLGEGIGDYRIFEHNNLNMISEMSATIRSQELIKETGKIAISHISRYAHKPHEEIQKYLNKADIIVAYDGMELKI